MNRVLLSVLLILAAVLDIEAQGHYENDFISFDYSSEYKRADISSAQHMLIKLETDDSFFSISEWNYGLDSDVDAWNDDIYNQYKSMPIKNGKLVTIEKRMIDTKNGREKGLFMLSNITSNGVNLRNANCLFVHRGNLYVASHMSAGEYSSFSPCYDFLDILKGLTLKDERSVSSSSNQQFRDKANKESGYWDERGCVYVNYFYGFSWNLGKEIGWEQEIGTELHTVFKAKAKDLPLLVFVHANEYNEKLLAIDIWNKSDEIKRVQQAELRKIGERLGGEYEMVSFEKTNLWGKHAVKYINIFRASSANTTANESTYSITYKTLHKGRIFSVSIEMSLEMYRFAKEENIDIEKEMLSGFKFTVDQ